MVWPLLAAGTLPSFGALHARLVTLTWRFGIAVQPRRTHGPFAALGAIPPVTPFTARSSGPGIVTVGLLHRRPPSEWPGSS